MSRYKAYPEYRKSGVQWLDDLPKHWNVKRTKQMFSLTRELVGKNSNEYQLLSLTLRGVIHRDISDGSGKIPAEFDTYQVVRPDNLIFCLFDIEETPRAIGLSADHGMITGAYDVYTCLDECIPKYAYYYFMHIDSFKGLQPFYTGLRKVVRAETFSNIEIPAPSINEQWQISNFLDHETAKIDALIEKQQRLIELLKEKRQAVISHAVTKGLNPNAPMKDSGVEWIGEVPAHWGITQIKYVAELNPRRALVELKPSLECNFVPMEKLKTESLLLDEIRTVDEVISGYTCFCDEDILMAKVTPCFENKNIAIASGLKNGVGFGSTEIYVLRTVKHVSNSFLLYRLQENEFMRIATAAMTGAGGLKRVPTDFVNSFKFAIPPIPEQLDICFFLEKQKHGYDSVESLARNQVELLRERRTALISSAVTGKIDVRDWQAAA